MSPVWVFLLSFLILIAKVNSLDANETCECGISTLAERSPVNEDEVLDMRLYPWLVTVHRRTPRSGTPNEPNQMEILCSGALITLNTILTAAHCLQNFTKNEIEMGFSLSDLERRKMFRVKILRRHPNFNAHTLENDIALVQLYLTLPCSPYTRPICLNEEDVFEPRSALQITGWQKPEPGESLNILRNAIAHIVDYSECEKYVLNPRAMICTVGDKFYTCQGDSGSAAIINKQGRFYVIGIISGGADTCPYDVISYLTKISAYYDFVKRNMTEEGTF